VGRRARRRTGRREEQRRGEGAQGRAASQPLFRQKRSGSSDRSRPRPMAGRARRRGETQVTWGSPGPGRPGLVWAWGATRASTLAVGGRAESESESERARERESERAKETARKRARQRERQRERRSGKRPTANALHSTRLLPTMAAIAQQVAGTSWASPMYTHWVLGTSMQARPGQGGGPKSGRPERGNLPGRRQPRASQSSARMSLVCVPLRWRRA